MYATPAELAEHLSPSPAPANAIRLLERASRDVNSALKTAVYAVDAAGMPTEERVIKALREATLEQIAWRLSRGETNGLPIGYDSVAIGSVKLSGRSGGKAGGSVGRLGEQAWEVLVSAGLTGHEPWTM